MTRATAEGPRAHFHGVLRCGSPFVCPVCSAALRRERAADVVKCVEWWRAAGGTVELLTLTLRHELGDDLGELNRARQRAWRLLTSGKPWKRLAERLGLVHMVRGTDDTHGAAGWHPHLHAVLFTRPVPGVRARADALRDLRERWARSVRRAIGAKHEPSWRGVDLRPCRKDEYVAKLGLELVATDTKHARGAGGLTPWEIASRAAAGDVVCVPLWIGYTKAMKGVRQLTWSRGLRLAAALEAEKTDQAIIDNVDDDTPEIHVASIPAAVWDEVAGMGGALYAIKRAAESSGALGIATTLALYRWGLAPPDDGEPPDPLVLELMREIAPAAPRPRLELVA